MRAWDFDAWLECDLPGPTAARDSVNSQLQVTNFRHQRQHPQLKDTVLEQGGVVCIDCEIGGLLDIIFAVINMQKGEGWSQDAPLGKTCFNIGQWRLLTSNNSSETWPLR